MNPSPVFRLSGTVFSVSERHVAAAEARPAERDESGRIVRQAREARAAYDVLDVTVHTDDGGYCTVLLRADGLPALGGEIPAKGHTVSNWPFRTYVSWQGPEGRRYSVVGYSVATDVFLAESKAKPGPTRVPTAV